MGGVFDEVDGRAGREWRAEVELVPMDDIDELNPEERARLHGFLAESIRKHVPGTGIPARVPLPSWLKTEPNPDRVLSQYGVSYVVWAPDTPLALYLAHDDRWHVVERSSVALVFARR